MWQMSQSVSLPVTDLFTSSGILHMYICIYIHQYPYPSFHCRMLRGLLSAHGANNSLVTVFVDGFFQEPVDVAGLFAIRAVQVRSCSSWGSRAV